MSTALNEAATPLQQEWQVFHRGRPKWVVTSSDAVEACLFTSVVFSLALDELTALPADYVRAREREMRRKIDRNPVPFAYHEAGHAVVAHHLGAEVRSLSIVPQMTCNPGVDFADGVDSLGRMAWAVPDQDPSWSEGTPSEARRKAFVALAGLAAEFRLRGKSRWKQRRWEPDWKRVLCHARAFVSPSGSVPAQIEIWKARVAALIEEHWPAVCRIGDALAKARQLDQAELTSLLAESFSKYPKKKFARNP